MALSKDHPSVKWYFPCLRLTIFTLAVTSWTNHFLMLLSAAFTGRTVTSSSLWKSKVFHQKKNIRRRRSSTWKETFTKNYGWPWVNECSTIYATTVSCGCLTSPSREKGRAPQAGLVQTVSSSSSIRLVSRQQPRHGRMHREKATAQVRTHDYIVRIVTL